jgi:hypothetical protein
VTGEVNSFIQLVSSQGAVNDRVDGSQTTFLESTASTRPAASANKVEQTLVLKALAGLLAFDALGFGHDFARMHRFVRDWRVSSRSIGREAVEKVCMAVNYACVWYPKRILCLQRAAITTCLMRHCGIPATMVLGAQTLPFKAHAWTEVDGRAINERRDVQSIYEVWERC